MNETQIKPQHLWDLYKTSYEQAKDLLSKLGLSIGQKIENSFIWGIEGEIFVLTVENDLITQVNYRTATSANYFGCIEYAKNSLKFEIVFEESNQSADILRLDSDKSTLNCIIVCLGDLKSFSITLREKLPALENKVEVILRPPPPLD